MLKLSWSIFFNCFISYLFPSKTDHVGKTAKQNGLLLHWLYNNDCPGIRMILFDLKKLCLIKLNLQGYLFTLFATITVDMKYILDTTMSMISLYTTMDTVGRLFGAAGNLPSYFEFIKCGLTAYALNSSSFIQIPEPSARDRYHIHSTDHLLCGNPYIAERVVTIRERIH